MKPRPVPGVTNRTGRRTANDKEVDMSDGYGKQSAGFGISREQSIELIVHACLDNGITDTRQIAYVLATAQHESNDFHSPDEEWGRKQAITNAYHGGEEYYGRGYAHLTHQENYRRLGIELGIADELVEQPSRAAEPDIATRILVLGMRDGTFVPGHALDDHIDARQADYDGARAIINPRDIETAATIAGYARDWEALIPAMVARIQRDGIDVAPQPAEQVSAMMLARGDANQNVFEMQQYLVALGFEDDRGRAIALDGDFGPGTEQAVRNYQRDSGVEPVNGCVDAVLFAQLRADTLQADPEFRRRTMTDLHGPLNGSSGEIVVSRSMRYDSSWRAWDISGTQDGVGPMIAITTAPSKPRSASFRKTSTLMEPDVPMRALACD